MERIVGGFCALMGLIALYMGLFQYGFWIDGGPGGGFLPTLMGVLILILSILVIVQKKDGEDNKLEIKQFIPAGMIIVATIIINLIGMIGTVFVLVFSWLKFLEKYNYKRSGIISILVTIFIYGVFKLWLQVPFPMGILGI